ncbi:hypothetical protein BDR26DRAFT_855095 [Obelidium mucronatum]|nr:hypothetical protein BDR26DRAFT_855095 [Obelidium mucronatum]
MTSHRQLKDILSSLSTSSQSCFSKSSSIRIEACPINDELAAWPLAENVSHPLRTLLQLQTGFIIIAKKGKNSVDCACVKIVPEDAGQTSQEFEFPSLDRGYAARQFLSQCIQLSEVRSQSRFSMIWPVFVLCSTGTREKLSYLGLSMGRMQPDTPLSVISVESCGIATEHTIPFSAASLVHDFMDAKRAFDKTEPNASSVSLDTTWDSVQKLLSAPSFVTSMTMRISYVPGTVDTENHTQTQRLRTELEKLNCLHRMQNGFISFGVIGRDSSIAKKSLAAFLQDSGLDGEDRDGIVNTVLTSANGEVPTEKDYQVDGFLDR